jgi:hypothetical protein
MGSKPIWSRCAGLPDSRNGLLRLIQSDSILLRPHSTSTRNVKSKKKPIADKPTVVIFVSLVQLVRLFFLKVPWSGVLQSQNSELKSQNQNCRADQTQGPRCRNFKAVGCVFKRYYEYLTVSKTLTEESKNNRDRKLNGRFRTPKRFFWGDPGTDLAIYSYYSY